MDTSRLIRKVDPIQANSSFIFMQVPCAVEHEQFDGGERDFTNKEGFKLLHQKKAQRWKTTNRRIALKQLRKALLIGQLV